MIIVRGWKWVDREALSICTHKMRQEQKVLWQKIFNIPPVDIGEYKKKIIKISPRF